MIIPVVITVFADKSFTFICKTPPAAVLLKKVVNVFSGLIPISALGVHDPERLCWPFIATNIVFGLVLWTAARFQAGRGVNYIEL